MYCTLLIKLQTGKILRLVYLSSPSQQAWASVASPSCAGMDAAFMARAAQPAELRSQQSARTFE